MSGSRIGLICGACVDDRIRNNDILCLRSDILLLFRIKKLKLTAKTNGGILFLHLRNDFLKYATFETATIQKLM